MNENEEHGERYKLQLVDRETFITRSVRISQRGLRMLGVGAAVVVVLLTAASILSVYTLMRTSLYEEEKADLREANRIQQEQILRVSKKAAALAEELDLLHRTEDGLRAIVGAPPATADAVQPQPQAQEDSADAIPPTGGAPHALTTDEVGEALTMIETRLASRRTSFDLLAGALRTTYPGAAAYISNDVPQTVPSIWPTEGFISSPYGLRWNGSEFHQGIDIAADTGTPIVATADGVVTAAGWSNSGYGNMVDIDHGDGITTRYGHASAVAVSPGQQVRRGQTIAYVGSTGYSTGPHLHYEVRLGGQPVNPAPYL